VGVDEIGEVGEVEVGLGAGDVPVGLGLGEVPVGLGVGVVLVGLGVVGVGVGVVLVGLGVVGVGVGAVPVGVGVGGAVVGGAVVGGAVVGGGVVGGGVVGGVTVAQVGAVIVSSSRLTCPLRASARPAMVSPVSTEIDVRARMVPVKAECVPRVAELPTCQNTLHAWAPLVSMTLLAESVVSVEGAWKMKTALGSPPAFRVSDPPTSSEEDALYTPGASVLPAPMKAGTLAVGLRPAASL
jgi:hypothetical protein